MRASSHPQQPRKFITRGLVLALAIVASCTLEPPRRSSIPTVDAYATQETKSLFVSLWTIGKSNLTLVGHQDDTYSGVGWLDEPGRSDTLEVSGSYPAVYGWDLSKLELGGPGSFDRVPFDTIRDRIIEAYRRGGVITISWHMFNPVTFPVYNENSTSLAGTFYDTTEAVSAILPGGSNHVIYRQWLDRFAAFDRSLTVSGVPWNPNEHLIPVIFRPFHEHNGSAFWWGGEHTTEADYIALWRFTVEYLRDTAGLHNLLYAYSPDTRYMQDRNADATFRDIASFQTQYFYAYPGDEYVDVFGLDSYAEAELNYGLGFKSGLDMLVQTADSRADLKIPALTEVGGQRWPDPDWWTTFLYPALVGTPGQGQVAWALIWRNVNPAARSGPYSGSSDASDFVVFKERRPIIFEDEIPFNLYTWPFAGTFAGIWQGIDDFDLSETTLALRQTGGGLTGEFTDSWSGSPLMPGYFGSGSGTVLSDDTAEMVFELMRSDGSSVTAVCMLTLSDDRNMLTLEIAGTLPTTLHRR